MRRLFAGICLSAAFLACRAPGQTPGTGRVESKAADCGAALGATAGGWKKRLAVSQSIWSKIRLCPAARLARFCFASLYSWSLPDFACNGCR
jgi:hypothetical protein